MRYLCLAAAQLLESAQAPEAAPDQKAAPDPEDDQADDPHAYRASARRYLAAAERGLRWILAAQHPQSGGWSGTDVYGITYNDDVMTGTLRLLRDVAGAARSAGAAGPADEGAADDGLRLLPEELRVAAREAYEAGIACILRTQITVTLEDGTKLITAWCQQHSHEAPFAPIWARSFEPPAICSYESCQILRLLMDDPDPTPAMIRAVHTGCQFLAWEDVRIQNMRLVTTETRPVTLNGRTYTTDRRLEPADPNRQETADPGAEASDNDEAPPDLWARFYALSPDFDVTTGAPATIRGSYPKTLEPVWCDADCIFRSSYNELSRERRNGYDYLNTQGAALLKRYASWAALHLDVLAEP